MTAAQTGSQRVMAVEALWRSHYQANRYARLLSQQELNARIRDLIVNFVTLTREAKIAPVIFMAKIELSHSDPELRTTDRSVA